MLLTTELPPPSSPGGAALAAVSGQAIFAAVDMLAPEGHRFLTTLAAAR